MRRLLSVMAVVLLASPCFAQDDFGGGFDSVLTGSDIDALLGGGNRGNRGNNNNGTSIPNPEQLLLQMKDMLKAKKVPLSKDQEKALKTFLDTETVAMRTELEAMFTGNRGNNNNNNRNANILTELFTIVGKHNTELLTQVKADLTPDQVSLIAKAEKDKKVCSVVLDLFNAQQLQNREGNRGNNNRGNNQGGFNPGFGGFGGLDGGFQFAGGGFEPQPQRGGGNFNNNNNFLSQVPDRAFCTTANSTTAERLAPISQILTKGKKPLTADQEKKVASLIEARLPLMQEELREKDPQVNQLINQLNQLTSAGAGRLTAGAPGTIGGFSSSGSFLPGTTVNVGGARTAGEVIFNQTGGNWRSPFLDPNCVASYNGCR